MGGGSAKSTKLPVRIAVLNLQPRLESPSTLIAEKWLFSTVVHVVHAMNRVRAVFSFVTGLNRPTTALAGSILSSVLTLG